MADNDAVRMVSVDGAQLRVAVRQGGGSRPPLVLMNGIGAALETFQPLVNMLDPAPDVIRFDVPGVGGSPLPARPYRFPSLARLVGRMLDELGVAEVDVLGISWGGGLAQQFAWTERRRCRRLVLVATGTGAVMVPGSPRVLAKLASPRRYGDPTYMIRIAPELYGGSMRRDPDRLRRLLHGRAGSGDGRGYALQLAAGFGWTSVGFLPMLPQRTLVLTGDDDPIIPTANGRILAALIRRSTLRIYRGGHVELVADPAPFAALIEQFLSHADAPAGPRRPRRAPPGRSCSPTSATTRCTASSTSPAPSRQARSDSSSPSSPRSAPADSPSTAESRSPTRLSWPRPSWQPTAA